MRSSTLVIALLTATFVAPFAAADDYIGYACAGSDIAGPDACLHATTVDGNGAICVGALVDGSHVAVACNGDPNCNTYLDIVGVFKTCL